MMKRKVLWIDCETTGTKSEENCLVQLAFSIDIDGTVMSEGDITTCPTEGTVVEKAALEIQGRTLEDIQDYQPVKSAHYHLLNSLGRYVDKYNRKDKFTIAGYFVGFDVNFLRRFFEDANDQYYGSWFKNIVLDVQCTLAEYCMATRFVPSKFKLGTVYEEILGKKLIGAHDALADIRATRELYLYMMEELYGKARIRSEAFGGDS